MIELKHVTKHYENHTALDEINLQIEQGEIFGIIGKSGAGKSTLIRCINRLEQPSSGQIIVNQQDITHLESHQLRAVRRQVGMIFQHFNLVQRKTVWANMALPLQVIQQPADQITKRVAELCQIVGLSDKQTAYPAQLSGGQKQRVAIARALSTQPKILLCDEATSALDPETTRSILNLLKAINHEFKLTIVLITHEMDVIKSICDRVAVIDQGKIVEVNKPLQLLLSPQSQVAKEFLQQSIQSYLPAGMQDRLRSSFADDHVPLAHLAFVGDTASKPLIAELAVDYGIKVNILQADVEYINQVSLGHMLVELPASKPQAERAIRYFNQHHVQVEVIGYVPHQLL